VTSPPSDAELDARQAAAWHRHPEYPGEVGGLEVYTAVLEDGVRTPGQFAAWLERRAPGPMSSP
jgi:hypothetical protein